MCDHANVFGQTWVGEMYLAFQMDCTTCWSTPPAFVMLLIVAFYAGLSAPAHCECAGVLYHVSVHCLTLSSA